MRTLVLKVSPKDPDRSVISLSAKIIKKGGLIAFPTETVYGIAANLLDKKALGRLYRIKNRPRNKPFTVHIADIGIIRRMGCTITKKAKALIRRLWPGPLTVILKSKDNKRIGFRMPDHKVALRLIKASGIPVVAPSANISGHRPPTDSKTVLKYLGGKIDILLDGGPCKVGVESTVIDLTMKPPKILREGAISREKLMKVLGWVT